MVFGLKISWSKPDIGIDEIAAVLKVLESGWVSQGQVTDLFEERLARYAGSKYAVFLNNGTSALIASYMAEGMSKGDVVAIPDYTHIATANAAKVLGAKLVLVDVDSKTWNMDLTLLEKACRKYHPKFVVSVDVAGLPNHYNYLREMSVKYDFTLIIDGAESFGAKFGDVKVHGLGFTATASFHTAKQLTTIEGGAVFTNDDTVNERVRLIRNHGGAQGNYWSKGLGYNFRPDDLHAAIGLVQLAKLDKALEHRQWAMNQYLALDGVLRFQHVPQYVTRHGYMMCLTFDETWELREKLKGIETRQPWPPIHEQPEYQNCKLVSNSVDGTDLYIGTLALPLHNTISEQELNQVITTILN